MPELPKTGNQYLDESITAVGDTADLLDMNIARLVTHLTNMSISRDEHLRQHRTALARIEELQLGLAAEREKVADLEQFNQPPKVDIDTQQLRIVANNLYLKAWELCSAPESRYKQLSVEQIKEWQVFVQATVSRLVPPPATDDEKKRLQERIYVLEDAARSLTTRMGDPGDDYIAASWKLLRYLVRCPSAE